jgi:RecB family endonuclease NucS
LRDASGRKSAGTSKKKKSTQRSPEVSLDQAADDDSMDSGMDVEAGSTQIRALIHDRPDCLEPGLSIYTDADAEPVGLDFPTDVGLVDLLARDDAGGLVVVLVTPDSSKADPVAGKELVSQALERVGWVRKHIAEPKQEVRAIVLIEQVPDDFSYTAAAVSSTVNFKTYRLEINFSDVEV